MPEAITHTIFGSVVAYLMYAYVFFPNNMFTGQYAELFFAVAICSTAIIASQLPDVDHHASRVAVWLTFISFLWVCIFLYQGQEIKVWYVVGPMVLLWGLRAFRQIKHRGICHNWLFGSAALTLPLLFWFNWQFYVFGIAISASHILLDGIVGMFKKETKHKGGTTHGRKKNGDDAVYNFIFAKRNGIR